MQPHQKISYLPFLVLNSVEEIAKEFSLGKVQLPPKDNSSFDPSFLIQTDTGNYQVRSYVKSQEDVDHFAPLVQREISYTKFLEFYGFLVPHHHSFQPFLFQKKLTTLTTLVEGERIFPGLQPLDRIARIGELIGKMHQKSLEYGHAGATPEQRNSFRERVDENLPKIKELLGIDKSQFMPLLDQYKELREKRKVSDLALPRGLTHGELTCDKIVETKAGLVAFDFEGLKFTPLTFDFGQTFATMCFADGILDFTRCKAFFDAYQKQRPLTTAEKAWIPSELIYNYLHKIEWRLLAALSIPHYVERVKQNIIETPAFIEQAHKLKIE